MAGVTLLAGKNQFFDLNGNPLVGGLLDTWNPGAGITTPKTTYADAALTTPKTNPIVLDARGEATIFWSGGYNVRLRDSGGGVIWTVESINTDPSAATFDAALRADLASTVNGKGSDMIGAANRIAVSIAALRALSKTGCGRAFVLGYYVPGDAGGGQYWYDSTDVTSADNGGTIIVAADSGRWKLDVQGEVSVRQFGAKGDGVTDDTAAFQAAVSSPFNAYAPRGNYAINGTITITTGQWLVGEGETSTTLVVTNTTSDVFIISGNYCGMRGFRVRSSVVRTAGRYVVMSGFWNFVSHVNFFDAFNCIECSATLGGIVDCSIRDVALNGNYCIKLSGAGSGMYIDNVTADQTNTAQQPLYGLWVEAAGGATIKNSDFIHCGHNVYIAPDNGHIVQWCSFYNVQGDTSGGNGIYIHAVAGAHVWGLELTACWGSSCFLGIAIDGAGDIDGVEFTALRAITNQQNGVIINSATAKNIKFNGGFICNNSQQAPNTFAGFAVATAMSGLTITGMRIGDGLGFGVTQNYGIFLSAVAIANVAITGNNLTGNSTGAMLDGSTGTVKVISNNLGYGFGSAVYDPPNLADGAGATTTVTVTGAVLGDFASATFSLDLQGITLTAWVSAANTVSVRFQNESGGALDLASGTLRAKIDRLI